MTPKEQVLAADGAGAAGNQELEDDQLASPFTGGEESLDPKTVDNEPFVAAEPTSAGGERAGLYLAMLIALAVPSLIVFAFLLPQSDTSNTFDDAVGQTQSTGLGQLEIDTSLPPAAESAEVVDVEVVDVEVASATEESSEVAPTTSELPAELTNLDPDAVEVIVYDESPSIDDQFTFAIRVKSVGIEHEINIEHFTVTVENSDGEQAPSRTRFVHDSLPVGSSAIASVEASDTGSDAHFVVVCIGDTEFGRVHIDVM